MLMAGGGEELKILLDTIVPLGFGSGDCVLPLHVPEFSYGTLSGANPTGARFLHPHPCTPIY